MKPYQVRKTNEVLLISRSKFLTLLQTGINNKEYQFARQSALIWSASYPGDLHVQYMYATILADLNDNSMAIRSLSKLLKYDPEFTEAQRLLCQLLNYHDTEQNTAMNFLQRGSSLKSAQASWLASLLNARIAYETGDLVAAERAALDSMSVNSSSPLPAIFHMRIIHQMKNEPLLANLGAIYTRRWPECLAIKIWTAIAQLQLGNDGDAVEALHWCASHDISGQVINRILGPNHAFKPLWPENPKVYFDLPVPAAVASDLGWNVLSTNPALTTANSQAFLTEPTAEELLNGTNNLANKLHGFAPFHESTGEAFEYTEIPSAGFLKSDLATPPSDEVDLSPISKRSEQRAFSHIPMDPSIENTLTQLNDIQHDFEILAKKNRKATLAISDGRFPCYVIISSRNNLSKKYGNNNAEVIINLMHELGNKFNQLSNWRGLVLLPDDEASCKELNIPISSNCEAWTIKQDLVTLDAKLATEGEMIGALLIVGGNDIIPFHVLPNPTVDGDKTVYSDNPYGSPDENYFVQQWPVGRLPDESNRDASFLLDQLHRLNREYSVKVNAKLRTKSNPIFAWFENLRRAFIRAMRPYKHPETLALSAEVWKTPSAIITSIINKSESLLTCPPTKKEHLKEYLGDKTKFAYFNLHGIESGSEWYGQSEYIEGGSDFPIAMGPTNFRPSSTAPEIVLSEACYGANIINKNIADSVALTLIAQNCRSFIGSTCISYGSVSKQLVAADLLAKEFWNYIKNNIPSGYALMRAKIAFSQKMTEQQGYLDGEDQKTILSFVLYGDPLASASIVSDSSTPLVRPVISPVLNTVSDSTDELVFSKDEMPPEILNKVNKTISSYLPNLNGATITLTPQLTGFKLPPNSSRVHDLANSSQTGSQRYVVMLKKSVYCHEGRCHDFFARLTFTQDGEIHKLSASR